MGGVLGKAGVPGGREIHQLGQLLVEALPADPVLDRPLALEVSHKRSATLMQDVSTIVSDPKRARH